MEAIEYILSLAFGIGVLLVLGYLMSFITGGISKFFGTTSTLNGNIVATPDTLDENIRELKDLKHKFITSFERFKSKTKDKSQLDTSEQIRLLSELDKLKTSNAISEEEYLVLKSKILS